MTLVAPAPQPSWTIGQHALLCLRAVRRHDRTEVHPVARRIPFQYQGAHYQDHDDEPFVLLHNSAGGYVEGDVAELHVDADAGTRTLLTTMGATKFYKCTNGASTVESVVIRAGSDALLEYLPDEAIPYAESRAVRTTRIELAPTARAFVVDLVAAGRVHHGDGETFAFHSLRSELDVRVGGRRRLLDRLIAEPPHIDAVARMWRGRTQCATIVVLGDRLGDEIERSVERACDDLDVLCGASRRGALLCVRLLAGETWEIHEAIFRTWALVRPRLAGKDARPIRKC